MDRQTLDQAKASLGQLLPKPVGGLEVLDLGCGSGLFSLALIELGAAKVIGLDISAESIQASRHNQKKLAVVGKLEFIHGSVFDLDQPNPTTYDLVYSWGVLHHTGDMKRAIRIAARLVKPGGHLVIAIYASHFTSPVWKLIKYIYNHLPLIGRRVMEVLFGAIIALAKWGVTGQNPFARKRRGMTFYYDLVDWLGGYPYEYATKDQIEALVIPLGFRLEKFKVAAVPTGCHEYVFGKDETGGAHHQKAHYHHSQKDGGRVKSVIAKKK